MVFCTNCGSEVQGRFCAKCGTAVGASAGGPASSPAPGGSGQAAGGAMPPPPPVNPPYGHPQYENPPGAQPGNPYYINPSAAPGAPPQAAGLEENIVCALCYALTLLTGILFLVLAPYNQNRLIRFHAFQSIFFWAALVVCWIVEFALSAMLAFIPIAGPILSMLLGLAIFLGAFILWLMLMYKAYNRERWVLPFIGPLAEKQA